MKRTIWTLGYALSFVLAALAAGYVGFTQSIELTLAPAPAELAAAVVPNRMPAFDPGRPTVAIVLDNTPTESTDFLGPYAMSGMTGVIAFGSVACFARRVAG